MTSPRSKSRSSSVPAPSVIMGSVTVPGSDLGLMTVDRGSWRRGSGFCLGDLAFFYQGLDMMDGWSTSSSASPDTQPLASILSLLSSLLATSLRLLAASDQMCSLNSVKNNKPLACRGTLCIQSRRVCVLEQGWALSHETYSTSTI
jgi:hypothetical protein